MRLGVLLVPLQPHAEVFHLLPGEGLVHALVRLTF